MANTAWEAEAHTPQTSSLARSSPEVCHITPLPALPMGRSSPACMKPPPAATLHFLSSARDSGPHSLAGWLTLSGNPGTGSPHPAAFFGRAEC